MNHSLWRDNETQKRYRRYVTGRPVGAPCEFCEFSSDNTQVIRSEDGFWIVKNIFPYTIWDSFFVEKHLMLIPERHVDSIGKFTLTELTSFASLISEYEGKGYSIYSRAANNGAKSIPHQHTHLIKVSKHKLRLLIFSRRFSYSKFR